MSKVLCTNSSCSLLKTTIRHAIFGKSTPSIEPARRLFTSSLSSATRRTYSCPSPTRHSAARPKITSVTSNLVCRRRTIFTKVVRHYEEVPREYKDQTGLPFRNQNDLTASEIDGIFGRAQLGVREANQLLRIIHGRRVAGTLDDPAFAINTSGFTEEQQRKALVYLRKTLPVNEVYNAGLRAEDELNQMDEEEKKAAAKTATETSQSPEQAENPDGESKEGEYKPDPVYGTSRFDMMRHVNEIRNRNRERHEKQLEKEKEEEERRMIRSGELMIAEDGTRLPTNPKIREYWLEATSDMKEPPKMSHRERIVPSVMVILLTLGFFAGLSTVYEEPADRYRLFREVSPAWATVGTIIGVTVLVQVAWKSPPLWKFLNRHFVMVVGLPRPFSFFNSIFSHQDFKHLLTNMVPLWFIGTRLHEDIGRADFLMLYLACGSLGFASSLIVYALRGMLGVAVKGASGATLGIWSAYFWMHRNDGFKIFGLPDGGIHGIVILALLVASQVGGASIMFRVYNIDVISHIGGMVTGILGIEVIQWLKKKEKERKVLELLYGPDGTWRSEGNGEEEPRR